MSLITQPGLSNVVQLAVRTIRMSIIMRIHIPPTIAIIIGRRKKPMSPIAFKVHVNIDGARRNGTIDVSPDLKFVHKEQKGLRKSVEVKGISGHSMMSM